VCWTCPPWHVRPLVLYQTWSHHHFWATPPHPPVLLCKNHINSHKKIFMCPVVAHD
jgi:hypothetical protein